MKTIILFIVVLLSSPFVIYVLFKFAAFGFYRGRELVKRFPKTTGDEPKERHKSNG